MYSERKIHGGLVGFLLMAAAIIIFIFHSLPSQKRAAQLNGDAQTLAAEIEDLTGKKIAGTSTALVLSEIEQRELEKAIPVSISQDTLITDINNVTKNTNISFNSLSFGLQEDGDLPSITISAGFQGTQADIVRFLKLLESNQRKFVVKNAGISRSKSAGGLDLMNLNLTLQSFYRASK